MRSCFAGCWAAQGVESKGATLEIWGDLRHRGLVAADKGSRLLWALHRAALLRGLVPVVPAPVLAEGWRGGPQASLSRLLAGCEVEPLSEAQARAVGELAARARHDDVVDVTVVEGALRRKHAVVTSDTRHTRKIAQAAGKPLVIQGV